MSAKMSAAGVRQTYTRVTTDLTSSDSLESSSFIYVSYRLQLFVPDHQTQALVHDTESPADSLDGFQIIAHCLTNWKSFI